MVQFSESSGYSKPVAKIYSVDMCSRRGPLKRAVMEGLSAVFPRKEFSDQRVLIKPNLGGPSSLPRLYSMSDPALIAALADICLEWGARSVAVADHPAGYVEDTGGFFRSLDLHTLSFRHAFKFIDLRTSCAFLQMDGRLISSVVYDNSLIINTTLPKTHHQGTFSLCLKNLALGLAGQEERESIHATGLNRGIVELNKTIRKRTAVIDILDARHGQEGLGPHFGSPIDPGFMIFGVDPVAVDSYGAKLIGVDPEASELLALARAGKLGKTRASLKGDAILPRKFDPSPEWEFGLYGGNKTIVAWLESANIGHLRFYELDPASQIFHLISEKKINFKQPVTKEAAIKWSFGVAPAMGYEASQEAEIEVDL